MRITIALMGAISVAYFTLALAMEEPPASQAAPETATGAPSTTATEQPVVKKAPTTPTTSASPNAAQSESRRADSSAKIALTAGDDDAAAELKQLMARGYKGEAHGSEIWFCRKEVIMGSRFEQKVCFTPDQLKHIAADAQQQTDRIQRRISGDPRTHNP